MLLSLRSAIWPRKASRAVSILLFLFVFLPSGFSPESHHENSRLPKFDLQTEAKTNGVINATNQLLIGTSQLGRPVAVTGSKLKQDPSEVILARELVKRKDTLTFRDNTGNPVWNWPTAKWLHL